MLGVQFAEETGESSALADDLIQTGVLSYFKSIRVRFRRRRLAICQSRWIAFREMRGARQSCPACFTACRRATSGGPPTEVGGCPCEVPPGLVLATQTALVTRTEVRTPAGRPADLSRRLAVRSPSGTGCGDSDDFRHPDGTPIRGDSVGFLNTLLKVPSYRQGRGKASAALPDSRVLEGGDV